jgi:hypothetical protein
MVYNAKVIYKSIYVIFFNRFILKIFQNDLNI